MKLSCSLTLKWTFSSKEIPEPILKKRQKEEEIVTAELAWHYGHQSLCAQNDFTVCASLKIHEERRTYGFVWAIIMWQYAEQSHIVHKQTCIICMTSYGKKDWVGKVNMMLWTKSQISLQYWLNLSPPIWRFGQHSNYSNVTVQICEKEHKWVLLNENNGVYIYM